VPRFLAEMMSESNDELPVGRSSGTLTHDATGRPPIGPRRLAQPSLEVLSHGARPEQQEVVDVRHLSADGFDEPLEMLQPVWLAGALVTASAMAQRRLMSHVTRCAMARGNL
jgi:hypothetical protein